MKEKRLVDANHFMQVLKNIEYALKGELTHGKIKTSVVQMIEGSLNAEPTIAPESLQPLTYNENRDYIDCDEFICHKSKFTRRQQRDYIHRRRIFIDLVAEPRGWRFVEHITPDTAAEIKAWKKCAQQTERKG